jgi:Holliday junction DNA helicase RuvA
MIASITGQASYVGEDHVVVSISGIGLKVSTPKTLLTQIKIGQQISLFSYLVVREDLLALYGFETMQQRDLFTLLISVNGIGPKTGLAILSNLSIDQIKRAVINNQPEILSKVPGIGSKTAPKIILYLQGKFTDSDTLQSLSGNTDVDTEVLQALTNLGYSVLEAQSALQSLSRDAPQEVETRLKSALQYFSK